MSLKIDAEHGIRSGWDNFHVQLMRLMQKSDRGNYARLAQAFPNTAEVFQALMRGDDVPDLAYEEDETPQEVPW
jgi:hypothetical protein